MEQEKRLMIAFALSFAVLMAWRIFFVKTPPPPPKASTGVTVPAKTQPGNPTRPAAAQSETPSKAKASAKSESPPALPVQQGTTAQDIVVESKLYKVTLSSQGALIKSWILKKYKDENGNLLELVDQPACATLGFPMSVVVSDPSQSLSQNNELGKKLNSALFVAKATTDSNKEVDLTGNPITAPVTLEFAYSDGSVLARKQFRFGPDYEAHAEVSVSNGQRDFPVGVEWPGGFGDNTLPIKARDASRLAVYGTADKIETQLQGKVKDDQAIAGPLGLAGLEDHFFVNLFLPAVPGTQFPDDVRFSFGRRTWNPPDWKEKEPPRPLTATLSTFAPKPLAFRLFVAPKALDILDAQNPPLSGLESFGWFSFVAKPLFLGLRYINDNWTHNYGWAIIVLTLIINFAMFPLKVKSVRSAQKMQKIAPLMKDLQEKYKQYKFNDPRKQKMNEEMMGLYKKHGVNPLGGCWPSLLQLPFLYGFYRVLYQAIELRHAPWIWWVTDLSAVDTVKIFGLAVPVLTTLMVVSMFIVQKMTPMPATDPGQARMMAMMPVMMGVMFYIYALPSGLMLYYTTANVVGIAQQLFLNKTMPTQPLTPPPRKGGAEKE